MIIKKTVDGSSAIAAFEYDTETEILSIKFTSGGIYDYPGIPEEIVRRWMIADSAGKFFNKEIRKHGA